MANKYFKRIGDELWAEIEDFDGRYLVSDKGRVKSVARIIQRRKMGETRVPEIILKTNLAFGYPCVGLCKNGVSKSYRVHRLVAAAFLPNPENKPQVNHKNGVRHDNRLENLEWATAQENIVHSYHTLGNIASTPRGEKSTNAKLNEAVIIDYYNHLKNGGIPSRHKIRRLATRPAIRLILTGETWKHLNLNWSEVYKIKKR